MRSMLCGVLMLTGLLPAGVTMPSCLAQTCTPTATFSYTNEDGDAVEDEPAENYSGQAPVKAVFSANPSNHEGFEARYEWTIYDQDDEQKALVHRFEENLEYTFNHSGTFYVELKATFTRGGEVVSYPEEGVEGSRFTVSIEKSQLEMPNGFSPNEDGWNDVYCAKKTHRSIVEFHATIFNRWGQKLYSWDDVNGSWNGKVNGRVIKDGVYFVNVVAKGADGRVYHIRKDVNVMTRKPGEEGTTSGGQP